MKPTLIKIEANDVETTLHRYVDGKHAGTLSYANADVITIDEAKAIVEDYRVLGNKIYETTESESN